MQVCAFGAASSAVECAQLRKAGACASVCACMGGCSGVHGQAGMGAWLQGGVLRSGRW
jgi:hypothetical protein